MPTQSRPVVSITRATRARNDSGTLGRQPAAEAPGWSLLRLSAGQRLGLALGVILVLWAATFAVIA